MAKEYRFYCAGEWRSSDQPLDVINPYNGEVVGTTSFATDQDLEDAITAAERAFDETRRLQSYERAAILERLPPGAGGGPGGVAPPKGRGGGGRPAGPPAP